MKKSQFSQEITKFKEENTLDSYWVRNANYPFSWSLEKEEFIIGKNWLHDKIKIKVYGCIDLEEFGEHKGKIKATVPSIPNEEYPDVEEEIIGYFDDEISAMKAVVERNNPDYGNYYW